MRTRARFQSRRWNPRSAVATDSTAGPFPKLSPARHKSAEDPFDRGWLGYSAATPALEQKRPPEGGGGRFTLAFLLSGDKPTYGSEALIGRRVELSITDTIFPCSAKTVNFVPSGFLKVYFSL